MDDGQDRAELQQSIDDDIKPENVWFYCLGCDEEYHLPEHRFPVQYATMTI